MNYLKRLTRLAAVTAFSLAAVGKAHPDIKQFDLKASNLSNDGYYADFTFSMASMNIFEKLALLDEKRLRIAFNNQKPTDACPLFDINSAPYLMLKKIKTGKKVTIQVIAEVPSNDFQTVEQAACVKTPNFPKKVLTNLNNLQEAGGWMIVENGRITKDSLTPN
ncbi:MAG: hypothetical protein CMH30_07830 [Micavibrio sp.]|nr:hypothetical protein [Micavibrio sp.]|tara:strand:- start:1608 stop:2099 length:492 start_codon:yes stop_codon:yes gene_type:complete